jgi:uncharacterized cysteine cluster protein YcgN (CxxCxxCC family)
MEKSRYEAYKLKKEKELESLCVRCGACCGAFDQDPCVHLKTAKDGKYFCDIYENRLGRQKTVSGKSFECVRIEENLREFDPYPSCAYGKRSFRPV